MAKDQINEAINRLLAREKWSKARQLLENEREKSPDSHWVLTQLAVTYYEEKRYKEALSLLVSSIEIKNDCPLTLWNLAGTLDALRRYNEARGIFLWILKSSISAKSDPCWESDAWTASLKADCVFRLGEVATHQGNKSLAERFYRDYIDLWLAGIKGSYPIEEVAHDVQQSRGSHTPDGAKSEAKHISASGTIPRSVMKQSEEIYGPVVKISTFLKGMRGDLQDLFSTPSRRMASGYLKSRPIIKAKK